MTYHSTPTTLTDEELAERRAARQALRDRLLKLSTYPSKMSTEDCELMMHALDEYRRIQGERREARRAESR